MVECPLALEGELFIVATLGMDCLDHLLVHALLVAGLDPIPPAKVSSASIMSAFCESELLLTRGTSRGIV